MGEKKKKKKQLDVNKEWLLVEGITKMNLARIRTL